MTFLFPPFYFLLFFSCVWSFPGLNLARNVFTYKMLEKMKIFNKRIGNWCFYFSILLNLLAFLHPSLAQFRGSRSPEHAWEGVFTLHKTSFVVKVMTSQIVHKECNRGLGFNGLTSNTDLPELPVTLLGSVSLLLTFDATSEIPLPVWNKTELKSNENR